MRVFIYVPLYTHKSKCSLRILQMYVCRHIQVHAKGLEGFSNHWAKVRVNDYSFSPPCVCPVTCLVNEPKIPSQFLWVQ